MLDDKVLLVDRCYLSATAMAAAHQESYLLLHESRFNVKRIGAVVGGLMMGGCLVANVPAGVLIGLVACVWCLFPHRPFRDPGKARAAAKIRWEGK